MGQWDGVLVALAVGLVLLTLSVLQTMLWIGLL